MSEQEYKVWKLSAKNFLNLVAVEIDANGKSITLSGPNGAGKSNIIEVVLAALSGKEFKSLSEPVRRGETNGEIYLDLGDLKITRKFAENGTSSLVVTNAENMIYQSPQKILDALRSKLSFDPMEFSELPPKQQKEILLRLINLPIDLDDLDRQRNELYGQRTLVNRDVIQLTGQMDGIQDRIGIPDEEISTADVMDEMKAATEQIANNNKRRNDLDAFIEKRVRIESEQDRINAEILKLLDDAEHIKLALASTDQTIATITDQVEELVDPDLETFTCKMADVELINQHVREKQDRRELLVQITETKAKSQALKDDMTAIDELKDKTIRDANMPVPGLGFDENGLTFEGVPLSQRSTGEKIKISTRIYMAVNPNLKVIWIREASLLDNDSIDEVKAIAEEQEYQLFLEMVDTSGEIGIVIENGSIVKNNYEPEELTRT